jgi:hypothetical protein
MGPKTFFRIVFSASEPVISSAKVGFASIPAIVCFQAMSSSFVVPMQTSSISVVVLFNSHTIFSERCSLFTWLVPGSLQGHREWLALCLPVDRVEKFLCPLALVKFSL